MAGKYFTEEDIRKMMTEKVKGYLDQGWYFNFKYMRCSNGYEFAAVTDGKDTVVIYIKFNMFGLSSDLKVEKFTGYNNKYENIWLDNGKGEILETTQFLYKEETETYVIVNVYDAEERRDKKFERRANRNNFESKSISEPMKEALANFVKSKGIPGLKRFKASDISSVSYIQRQNKYKLEIKSHSVYIFREGWDVKVL